MGKKLDCLVFAPHPDDAEIFVGGTIATLVSRKYRVGLVDMTRGELGSQGTVSSRKAEAKRADEILRIASRKNLGLKDGGLSDLGNKRNISSIVREIRLGRPSVIIAPYWEDRHPDHVGASRLVQQAVFFAALRKYALTGTTPHAVDQVLYYPTRVAVEPSLVVDTSASFKTKLEAINCYNGQIKRDPKLALKGIKTLVSSPLALSSIEHRDGYFGSMIGVRYGEPFVIRNVIGVSDPVDFFKTRPISESLFWSK